MKKYILLLAMALMALSCSKDVELQDPIIAMVGDLRQTGSD